MIQTFFNKPTVPLYFAKTDKLGIKTAEKNLRTDLKKVFSKSTQVLKNPEQAEIVVGEYEILKDYLKNISLNTKDLFHKGNLRWESYILAVKNQQIIIVGSDMRGVIFGIYELCKKIGVSPWYFFADVPIKTKENFSLPVDFYESDYPSVQYRGIFINDEEELNNWAKEHTKDDTIGPETYKHIFELLLRLKANYIWPAMHVNYFNENPENNRLAHEMGIIFGTSHCDMLLRSNQNEWVPWLLQKGYDPKTVKYDYSIPGKNREILLEYWQESIQMNAEYEASYTVGMRGIHDSGFETKDIENSNLSKEEKMLKKKELLEEIITAQRQLLKDNLQQNPEDVLQTFVPYKEVLQYYDQGLKIPEDITIIWANDNYGYVRRFPSEKDQLRKGGHGLYYHSSYWAATNMHYLFISSTPLGRMKNELKKSWDNGIQKLWVLNVGALKPIEQDMEFFLRYAFEVGKENSTKDIVDFLSNWIDENFTGSIGEICGPLLNDFCQITNVRKIEQLDPETFSQTAYGDEGARRLVKLQEIYEKVNALAQELPKEEKDAFFQLVQMKIHASYYKNCEFYYGDRSTLAYLQGKFRAAEEYKDLSQKATDKLFLMIHFYNKIMSQGKWNQILTPHLAPPPNMKMFPTTKPALLLQEPSLVVTTWDKQEKLVLTLDPSSPNEKWFEIANTGSGEIPFEITAPKYFKLSNKSGKLKRERRIFVSVKEFPEEVTEEIIKIKTPTELKIISVTVLPEEKISLPVGCAMESDNYISIACSQYHQGKQLKNNFWKIIPYLGRGLGDGLEAYSPKLTALSEDVTENPFVTYPIYLKTSGSHLLEAYRLPTLNSVGKIRFAIGIDNHPPIVINSETTDEHRGNWKSGVLNEVDKLYLTLPYLEKGLHDIKLYMIDSYVLLSKLVIYTKDFQPSSLGPVYSRKFAYKTTLIEEKYPNIKNDEQICQKIYHEKLAKVPLPEILYCDEHFYQQHFLSTKLVKGTQRHLGKKRFTNEEGQKDVLKTLAGTKIKEKNGIVAFEVENVLLENESFYTTKATPDKISGTWEHIGTPTNGHTGLGMYIKGSGLAWENGVGAPSMHYEIEVEKAGLYDIWGFLKYDDKGSDSLLIALDGKIQPMDEQITKRGFFSYLNQQIWHWNLISRLEITPGKHDFAILGRAKGVKLDRFYLTSNHDFPPVDEKWEETSFKGEK